ncbi:VCBS repeat-containing protein [Maribacter sp. HTCC2170]|uniref:VCBS repeat-containing protein n=1 Tax=Maribacter sp. (strain HTCC2170 / KCCM 42371) TaxID=313603 RepID=UPI0005A01A06|nr:VCBS repeat-containing protein [Maribacter sp. HTCC2170]
MEKNNKNIIFILVLFLLHLSCTKDKSKNNEFNGTTLFEEVPLDHSNVDFSNTLTYVENINIIDYLYYYNGGGVALGDINNDGLDDIYFTGNQLPDKLYLNKGNLKFEDITAKAGVKIDSTWSTGVTMEDINNDGLIDIYVSKVGVFHENSRNLAYINQGNLKFKEMGKEIGLGFKGYSTQAAFLDYDNDGDMDMYLLNHAVHTLRSYGNTDRRKVKDSLSGDQFYENKLNEGQLNFVNITDDVGIYSSALGYGLGINASDVNGDGLTDIYVSNDFHENDYLYINNGRDPKSQKVTFQERSKDFFGHTSRFSMGMDIGDINGDTKPDIFTLDMMPYDREIHLKSAGEDTDKVTQIKSKFGYHTQYARNTLQINKGNGFADIAPLTKTHATDWSWSALIQDFDNDGRNDIFVTNGIYKRPNDLDYVKYLSTTDFAKFSESEQSGLEKKLIDKMPMVKLPNFLFMNQGNYSFEKMSKTAGLKASYSNGAAYSDLDNDGDLDLVVNNINESATILENKTSSNEDGNYVQFQFANNQLNSNALGVKIHVFSDSTIQEKQLAGSRGFQSSSTRILHFGLGKTETIDSIQVFWPDGTVQTENKIRINSKTTIHKQESNITFNPLKTAITNTQEKFPFLHFENDYLDYVREPLMPEKLSTEGPAAVYEDLDGDGIKDLFIGGARYSKPTFFKGEKNNGFALVDVPAFSGDERYEDIDAVAFDLENDGDLDLYVQSGGNDMPQGDPLFEDRMYINLGGGNFERLQAQLPTTNGGSLAAGDYNNDGFTDLFVGGRSMPGAYGVPPVSLILKNTGEGGFTVEAQDQMGMVTDSEWADINQDGFLDLVIVGDWMPISILMNQKNGKFKYDTPNLGLTKTAGLWNTIEIADIDDNGFPDIIAGNVGENFKWQASDSLPVKLYIHDFDENGQPDPIIFYPLFDQYVPFGNRDALNAQLPYLAKRFKTYEQYSKVKNIEDLTGVPKNKINISKEIHEVRSMIYMNSGESLKGHPLPKMAQSSTINDIVNSKNGVLYLGNYFGFVTEIGNNNGNPGGILSNFNGTSFNTNKELDLPKSFEFRKIIKINDDQFIAISNNNTAIKINLKSIK